MSAHTPNSFSCQKCGSTVEIDARFCPECGESFSSVYTTHQNQMSPEERKKERFHEYIDWLSFINQYYAPGIIFFSLMLSLTLLTQEQAPIKLLLPFLELRVNAIIIPVLGLVYGALALILGRGIEARAEVARKGYIALSFFPILVLGLWFFNTLMGDNSSLPLLISQMVYIGPMVLHAGASLFVYNHPITRQIFASRELSNSRKHQIEAKFHQKAF